MFFKKVRTWLLHSQFPSGFKLEYPAGHSWLSASHSELISAKKNNMDFLVKRYFYFTLSYSRVSPYAIPCFCLIRAIPRGGAAGGDELNNLKLKRTQQFSTKELTKIYFFLPVIKGNLLRTRPPPRLQRCLCKSRSSCSPRSGKTAKSTTISHI